MLKCNTAHSPLVEPDVKISLIRLSRRLSVQAGFYKYTKPMRLNCS
jgi:hypothetical protein